ncbi:hypothetical protein [Streptomyces sp. NPDC059489]|uniref:hypothetical protein n=1 Tax=Streptomyces sp. NPDC059489 TaxID=3346849 RepID=UPI0036CCE203
MPWPPERDGGIDRLTAPNTTTNRHGDRRRAGLADRSRRFWAWTIAGYILTAVSVPVLGLTGVLWVACILVVAERVGKAVRSPAKDTLLSHATAATGWGRGFAEHEAMDQVGALLGPLTVAGVLALTGDDYAPTATSALARAGTRCSAHFSKRARSISEIFTYPTVQTEIGGPSHCRLHPRLLSRTRSNERRHAARTNSGSHRPRLDPPFSPVMVWPELAGG